MSDGVRPSDRHAGVEYLSFFVLAASTDVLRRRDDRRGGRLEVGVRVGFAARSLLGWALTSWDTPTPLVSHRRLVLGPIPCRGSCRGCAARYGRLVEVLVELELLESCE